MEALRYLRKAYSLETLDTRFVIPAKTPPSQGLDELRSETAKPALPGTQPPRWRTAEFYFYYLAFILVVPLMFKSPMDLSKPSNPAYKKYSNLLSDGWIPGRKVDNSDGQYAGFRDFVPYLVLLMIAHPLLRRTYDYFWRSDMYTRVPTRAASGSTTSSRLSQGLPATAAADARLSQRISFDYLFGIALIVIVHGVSAAKILLLLYINFKIAKKLPRQYVPAATWAFNIGTLFANELSQGYQFSQLAKILTPSLSSTENWGIWLDAHGGMIPRWEVGYNIVVLRLISFNMDYYWSLPTRSGSPVEKKQLNPSDLSERDRTNLPARPEDYSLRNYLAYALYAPLYRAGPIVTFNDFISQNRYQLPTITTERTVLYGIRFAIVFLAMELLTHFIYVVAIAKANPDWNAFTPFQLSMLGYFNLHHIWLKLLIPWRFFRLWALIDGIDPPENMVRCMSNNYSTLAFWRAWHRSYNRFVVRYIYIPLGGSRGRGAWGQARSVLNLAIVFAFVAVWHDINLRLLVWGWMVTLFVIPQVIAQLLFPARAWASRPDAFRWICGVGAIGNILMMMIANLVGYALGLDGLKGLLSGLLGNPSGLVVAVGICVCLFIGTQVMFEVREEEKRAGIRLSC